MVGDKWHSLNGGDKYGSVFYLKTGGPCFSNNLKKYRNILVCTYNRLVYKSHYDLHKNFYQYLLHLDQLKDINRSHSSRLTARNLEANTLLVSSMDLLSH
ncbi:hypothetical protein BpHYR1_019636 [Brachionus plicatilis]|uniref:Uncharacterized protein n=1 Tax=Brachionus plicatilis TaxID=10195 RepID=A0A3M7PU16_BRAPC|nr:hypothetical protein BpHYR1_019636 [Brachionus plicatilis]